MPFKHSIFPLCCDNGFVASKPIISPSAANSKVFAKTLSVGMLYSATIGSINSLKPQEIT